LEDEYDSAVVWGVGFYMRRVPLFFSNYLEVGDDCSTEAVNRRDATGAGQGGGDVAEDLFADAGHGMAAARLLISVDTRESSRARSRDSPME